MVPEVAVMLLVCGEVTVSAVARPCVPAVLLMVAADVLEEVHCTWVVTSDDVPSLKLPLAVNCWVGAAELTLAVPGVTAMLTKLARVTFKEAVPLMP